MTEANRLPYGLAAYAYTRSAKTAQAVAAAVETGMISINHHGLALPEVPFGGSKIRATAPKAARRRSRLTSTPNSSAKPGFEWASAGQLPRLSAGRARAIVMQGAAARNP